MKKNENNLQLISSVKQNSIQRLNQDKEDQDKLETEDKQKACVNKDKMILDYAENPKLLWYHLKVSVKNLFFERYIITKQIWRLFK